MLNLFKLEKLKVKAFQDVKRKKKASPSEFEAMFNPTSFKQSYGVIWSDRQGINSSGAEASYERTDPSRLDLTFVLDGTGVHEMGISLPGQKSVTERVKEFMDVAFRYNGEIHQPNFLLVEWGTLNFPCRLQSVDVTYNTFDRDGTPLRAELAAKFVADLEDDLRTREEQKTSPDLTHSRVVRKGDTLPLLTKDIYGSSDYYLRVARINGLDNFRSLVPGDRLSFPPLGRLLRETGPAQGD